MNVVITGASSGIGLGIAQALTFRGHNVYCLSRHEPPENTNINFIQCDVADKASVDSAFKQFFKEQQTIDILVCNAGIGLGGATEKIDEHDMKKIFDVNFFGAVNCAQSVIPTMREQKYGKIVFISSVGAVFTLPFQAFYSASKTALISLSEGLAMELKPFGIKVGTVLPGDIRSGFTAKRKKDFTPDDVYQGRIQKSLETMERDERKGQTSERAGAQIAKYLCKRGLKNQMVLGGKYKLFCVLNKFLPRKLVLWVLSKMYG